MAIQRLDMCAMLLALAPYFLVVFLSLHAPNMPLPIPAWGKKKPGGPLGSEVSPNLQLLSPHLWPHPIWILFVGVPFLMLCPTKLILMFALLEILGVPILRAQHYEYLNSLRELPEYGFQSPTFGIIHGWRTLLYSLYLNYVAKPDVRDFLCFRNAPPLSFLPHEMPSRVGSRPVVPLGLPQRQHDQCCVDGSVTSVETWSKLVRCSKGNLPDLKSRQVFEANFASPHEVAVDLSPNEGAGAKGILCLKCSRPEVARMQSEIAHEHSVDKSWHVILSASDAGRACELGWAERGPPIVCKTFCQPGFSFAPDGWVFLYAPRDDGEVEVLRTIIEAAHSFAASTTLK